MDRELANRTYKSPPGVGAAAQQAYERQQDALAHERQRRAVEQSLLRRSVRMKRPA